MKTDRIKRMDELYNLLKQRGYRPELCYVMVHYYLNTDYTITRMQRYLSCVNHPPEEELIDEMLSIISDRDRYVELKIARHSQEAINMHYLEARMANESEE